MNERPPLEDGLFAHVAPCPPIQRLSLEACNLTQVSFEARLSALVTYNFPDGLKCSYLDPVRVTRLSALHSRRLLEELQALEPPSARALLYPGARDDSSTRDRRNVSGRLERRY
jgi:hypothetical protein